MADKMITNILKVREDSAPLLLEQTAMGAGFTLVDKQTPSSWFPTDSTDDMHPYIHPSALRSGIEPWLTSLFQSEHLSLLVGTGLSNAVQFTATGAINAAMSKPELDTEYVDSINMKANSVAEKSGRGQANIEDYIRVINELLRGLEVLGHDSETDVVMQEPDKTVVTSDDDLSFS